MKEFYHKVQEIWISEHLVLGVIVINAIALLAHSMCPEGSFMAKVSTHVDICCVVFFIIEAYIKIRNEGMRKYWSSWWNKFDFVIVLISLPVFLEPFIGLQGFATILILRLGRLFRLFRLMIFIPDLDHMFAGIARALKASIGVFAGLLIFNLIFAIGATILFGHYAPEHFGNPLLSIYSTFKIFTVEGWYDVPDIIAQRADNVALALLVRAYFVIVVVVGGILGLSLANAIFVDQMTMDNTAELETRVEKLTEEVRELKGMIANMASRGKTKK